MSRAFSRRAALRSAASLLGVAAAAPVLAACGSDGGAPAASGARRRGGTLRAAFTGGGATESLNFLMGPTALDSVRTRAAHGMLGVIDPTAPNGMRLGVLEAIEAADDLGVYTLRLRKGVTFTDGSTLTARDVAYSLNAPMTLQSLPYLKSHAQNFDLAKMRVVDDHTVELPTLRPIADGALILCQNTIVIKDGTTEFAPGTPTCGPFRITEFEPGQGTRLARFDGFYGDEPLLDGLELRAVPDVNARVSALTGGQIDFAGDVGPVKARTLEGQSAYAVTVGELPYATAFQFVMNLAHEPFKDVRVRQAFKLAADRDAMVKTVLFGRGFAGNDLPGKGFGDYATDVEQRPFDPAEAKALLAEAGAEGMAVTLTTGADVQGLVEVSSLYAENLKAVGVDITLDQRPPGQLFSDIKAYYQLPFAASYTPAVPPLSGYTSTRVAGSPSTFGFDRPDIDALVFEARGSADPAARKAKAAEAQRLVWDEGNAVIPVFVPTVNAHVAGVSGVRVEPWATFAEAALA